MFFTCLTNGFTAVQNVALIFPMERPVFLREVNNNMYRVGPYFWSKVFAELPSGILMPIIQSAIIYFAIGFNVS
jgi:hypothetical protein